MDPRSQKSRRGKDFSSYIACEFWDDQTGGRFVAGIVFDCRDDGSRRDQFFLYDGTIPESCYLVQRRAMDIAQLRTYLKALPGARPHLYDSNKRYREDLLAKWNVHGEQVCRMMKKAVSFRPIVNIQQFITENICDIPDKPDTEAMQQNIRDYKRHEELAKRQEEKIVLLTEIAQKFRDWQAAIERLQQQRFLTFWAEKEVLEQRIEKLEVSRRECEADLERETQRRTKLEQEAACADKRRKELMEDRARSEPLPGTEAAVRAAAAAGAGADAADGADQSDSPGDQTGGGGGAGLCLRPAAGLHGCGLLRLRFSF